jgi:hypothetical protein
MPPRYLACEFLKKFGRHSDEQEQKNLRPSKRSRKVRVLCESDRSRKLLDMGRPYIRPSGEKRWNAKLTEQQVREIREASGPHRAIGEKYGVTGGNVWSIKKRRSWKHVQ